VQQGSRCVSLANYYDFLAILSSRDTRFE
jgi:hypothetical protein